MIEQETDEWPMGMKEAKELQKKLEEERAERVNTVHYCHSQLYMLDAGNWNYGKPNDWRDEQGRDGYTKLNVEPSPPRSGPLARSGRRLRKRKRRPLQ